MEHNYKTKSEEKNQPQSKEKLTKILKLKLNKKGKKKK